MSENSAWPFEEVPNTEGLDLSAIFGSGAPAADSNPFDIPQAQSAPVQAPAAPVAQAVAPPQQSVPPAVAAVPQSAAPVAEAQQTAQAVSAPPPAQQTAPPEVDPIAAAFERKNMENAQKSLLEKTPVFWHKNVKEPIEDTSMTFEELRIRKSEDFVDLEEGKYVSWSVEYCGIRKDIKDPKGTTIISMKESIERSREFLEALKKAKDKNPDCYVKPKVVTKNKGIAAGYKGRFQTVEDARASDKVICLVPSSDGRIYELHKTEQGEFIAPKNKVTEFQQVRAGFTPALPLIPLSLMGQIVAFFRAFLEENAEYEAMAQIYWDKQEKKFFAFVPKQTVCKDAIEADLHECPYEDGERYICYADIHSHDSMDAFFSHTDDQDERGTGLYFVVGRLDEFFPKLKARISCGGSFVPIDPATVVEGLDRSFPADWAQRVTRKKERRTDMKRTIFRPTVFEEEPEL